MVHVLGWDERRDVTRYCSAAVCCRLVLVTAVSRSQAWCCRVGPADLGHLLPAVISLQSELACSIHCFCYLLIGQIVQSIMHAHVSFVVLYLFRIFFVQI